MEFFEMSEFQVLELLRYFFAVLTLGAFTFGIIWIPSTQKKKKKKKKKKKEKKKKSQAGLNTETSSEQEGADPRPEFVEELSKNTSSSPVTVKEQPFEQPWPDHGGEPEAGDEPKVFYSLHNPIIELVEMLSDAVAFFVGRLFQALSHPTAVVALIGLTGVVFTTIYKDNIQAKALEAARQELRAEKEESQRRLVLTFSSEITHLLESQKKEWTSMRTLLKEISIPLGTDDQSANEGLGESTVFTLFCIARVGLSTTASLQKSLGEVINNERVTSFMMEADEETATVFRDYLILARPAFEHITSYYNKFEKLEPADQSCVVYTSSLSDYVLTAEVDALIERTDATITALE